MKKYLIAGLAVVVLAVLVFASMSRETPPDYIEMEVRGLRFDAFGQSPVIVLADKDQKKALPIWIGIPEAGAIERELNQVTPPRPMTHDLLHSVLTQVQAKVKEIRILDLKDHTYFAKVLLTVNKELLEIDARPSDAIIIAMKSKSPIFVSAKILNDQGISVTRKTDF
ncbi:MAG: hypothetical protein A2170_14855, partial [Deltaproteobacteria bacterium RBG_13_53_10]